MYYALAVVALLILTFLPRMGLLALYNEPTAPNREREQVEDALKHLLDRERNGRHASPESLGGTLDLPRARVMSLIEDMEVQGLLEITRDGIAPHRGGRALGIARCPCAQVVGAIPGG